MLGVTVVLVYPLTLLGAHVLATAAVVFVLAWIGQFVGHRIEGRKPSFLEDVKFLLVGPAWLLSFVYRVRHPRTDVRATGRTSTP